MSLRVFIGLLMVLPSVVACDALTEPRVNTASKDTRPITGEFLSPQAIMAQPLSYAGRAGRVRGYIHYSEDTPLRARLVQDREMFWAPPPQEHSLWLDDNGRVDFSSCHGKYVEIHGGIDVVEQTRQGDDRPYALQPVLVTGQIVEWLAEVPSVFENPVADESTYARIRAERLAIPDSDVPMTCATFPE